MIKNNVLCIQAFFKVNFKIFYFQYGITTGLVPTRTGVTLSLQRFYYLRLYRDYMLDDSVMVLSRKKHLGGPYHATRLDDGSVLINHDDADIDKNSDQDSEATIGPSPAKQPKIGHRDEMSGFNGNRYEHITLSKQEMKSLMELYLKMENVCHELRNVQPCITTHDSQLSYYDCKECCPNGEFE